MLKCHLSFQIDWNMFVCFRSIDSYKHGNPLKVYLSSTRWQNRFSFTRMKNLNQEEPPKITKDTEPLRFNKEGSLWPVIFQEIQGRTTKQLLVVIFCDCFTQHLAYTHRIPCMVSTFTYMKAWFFLVNYMQKSHRSFWDPRIASLFNITSRFQQRLHVVSGGWCQGTLEFKSTLPTTSKLPWKMLVRRLFYFFGKALC